MGGIETYAGGPEGLQVSMLALSLDNSNLEGPAERLDGWYGGAISRALADGRFRGRDGESRFVSVGVQDRPDLLLLGPAGPDASPEERARRAAGSAVQAAREARAESLAFLLIGSAGQEPAPAIWQAVAEGLALGGWTYTELKADEERSSGTRAPERLIVAAPFQDSISPAAAAAVPRGDLIAAAQNSARVLVTGPGNVVTPACLAEHAADLGSKYGLTVQAWGREKLRAEGFGALLAVAKGSVEEPRFIILEHRGDDGAPCVLVGKGVTFDSGGISLKPASGMEAMKYDMAGAAAVLGAMEAAARLELPHRVIGLIPATENMPSGDALKPGDVIRGVSGKSMEIVNTDAEGRLILSDALSYALRLRPKAIVDLATLTGACVVALGHHAIGLMATDDNLARALGDAGGRSGERVWRLPLWREYRSLIRSDIADIKNSGGRPAGTITAGYFLREFVGDAPWAHLDIAGTAWAEEDRAYQPKGATGVGVRLLVEWLQSLD
jgi:leucyl aminopeptidase